MKALWTKAWPDRVEPPRPKRRLRRRSKAMTAKMAVYNAKAAAFLSAHPRCAVYRSKPSEEIHHVCGRVGARLMDERHWLAVSRRGHVWIHDHPEAARQRGFLGAWNRTEK